MKRKTSRLLMGFCVTALAASFSSGIAIANADGAEQEQPSPLLKMQEGASIRYMDPMGIRFVTDVATNKYEEIIGVDSEAVFGMLIIPKEILGDTVITAENYLSINAENIVAKTWLPDTETTKSFACALGGTVKEDGTYNDFPETYYNVELYAVSYCSYKATSDATQNTVIFAENPQSYSVAYIASALQARGETDAILSGITDSVLGDTMAFASETYVLSKGETLETVLNAEGLKATYSTENETIATVDQNGVVTGVGVGTAQITAKIGNKTATLKLTVTDIFEKPLDDMQFSLYEGSAALPKEYDGLYDSYTLAVKQNGVPVESDKYTFNSETQIITFNEAGVYELTYTLNCGGRSKELTCTATVGVVNGIDSIASECMPWHHFGATADWNQNMVTLTDAGISKPESAVDVGDNLLKCTVQNQWYVAPVFGVGDFLDHLSELNDSDYLRIWVYYTGTWSGEDVFHEWNFWGTGDPSRLGDGCVSRLPQNLGSANAWVGLDFTVADIKAQLEKQNQTYQNFDWFRSNAYLYTMIALSNPCDIYFYSVEFHKAAAYEIDASLAQGVAVQEKAFPLNTVEVDASGLEYGKVVEIVNAETSEVIATINGTGSFVMPYANVKLRITDIFEKPLDDLQLPLYSGSAALPEVYDGFYDSYTLTVKQNGEAVASDKYTFDSETGTITFNEAGVYELTYTLIYGDISKNLTRQATVGVLAVYDSSDKFVKHGWGGDYNGEAVAIPDTVGKPQNAMDAGNVALKFVPTERDGNYQIYPAIEIGNLTYILQNGADGDYISIWLYISGAPVYADNWYMVGNKTAGDIFGDVDGQRVFLNGNFVGGSYTGYPDAYSGNEWYELKFTVKELKDQIARQGADLNAMQPEWLLLSLGFAKSEGAAVYIYSAEYHKASAYEIDASSAQGVTVQEKAFPLNTVEVDASGLEYGKVVEIVNAETSEVIATINGTGSFVMPNANVKLTIKDIFEKPLDDLQFPLYEGSAALPEVYDGFYDSYTLTVKQNGEAVASDKYTFDSETGTITFNEAGVYELIYTLTYGDRSKELTRTATVGVLTEYSNANVPNYVDYCSNQLWGKGDAAAAKQLNDVSLNKPSSAIDVDSNTVLQYTTTGNQVVHALKVSYLTDILTNGNDNDYISIWMYRTGAAVSDNNFWMIGNAGDPYEWEGKMYVNYDADSTDGQTMWVNGDNKSATYSEEYAQYVGDEWFELKFTVKELKDQLNKQGADLETMQPQWILLSFGLSSATDSVSYYSIEYHKA